MNLLPPDPADQKPEKPLAQHNKKLIRYAELLATGLYTKADAARRAGFKPSTADKISFRWIGDNRNESMYPVLYDYYEKLRKKNLRELDINQQTIGRELALIAFSDVTRFIDLPSVEYDKLKLRAQETEAAIWVVEAYPGELERYRADLEEYNRERDARENGEKPKGRKRTLIKPLPPSPPTPHAEALYAAWCAMDREQQLELMIWKSYRAGSVRLKNREEIPQALLPAIAEISETRDGIRVKMHDKLGALDKLARWQKMYTAMDEEEGGAGARVVTEISLTVNGSKSRLLDDSAA